MHKINIIPSARKDLDGLDKKFFTQIKNKIISLASNPHYLWTDPKQKIPKESMNMNLIDLRMCKCDERDKSE